jgi:hypothetical protein
MDQVKNRAASPTGGEVEPATTRFFSARKESVSVMITPKTRIHWLSGALIAFGLGLVGACSDDAGKKTGAPCTAQTVCDGVCLVNMPGGMCAKPCDPEEGCGGECVKVEGGYYCLPGCAQDDDCRVSEGYVCVAGACRPPVRDGEECEEHPDCEGSLVCVGGHCGTVCQDSTDCADGRYCVEEGGEKGCAFDDCSSGVCNRPCSTHQDCSTGTYCGPDSVCVVDSCDAEGVCEHTCDEHTDCPDGTYCASVEGEEHCVFLPDDMGPGQLGASCAVDECDSGYQCLQRGQEDAEAYCTKECQDDFDCGPSMVCRETLDSNGDPIDLCFMREFCEPCEFDGQCGFFTQKCVAEDPAVGDGSYCSTICDPSRSDTCPVDSTCREAFYCESSAKWVADCASCEGTCGSLGAEMYQCFHDYGSCIGDGSLCAPCKHSGQCNPQGACLTSTTTGNQYCSEPCDENDRCPLGFWCVDVTGLGLQCVPREPSCSEPSGGRGNCDMCETLMDCESGSCVDFGWGQVCLDECTPGLGECPAYTACETVEDIHTLEWNLCMPQPPISDCGELEECLEHCPEGPTSCDGNEPSYCNP